MNVKAGLLGWAASVLIMLVIASMWPGLGMWMMPIGALLGAAGMSIGLSLE